MSAVQSPSPQPTILTPLYMRGMVVSVSQGSIVNMAPASTAEHKILTVIVQGITFIISRDMVLQDDRLPHLLPKRGLPIEGNFFARALQNHDDKDLIEIDAREGEVLGDAKFYPVVFDYLKRRLRVSSTPLCDYHMSSDDAIALHALLDVLFMIDPNDILPMTPDGRTVYVAVAGTGMLRHANSNGDCCDMCIDPRFVRLVREVKNPDKSRDREAKDRRKAVLLRLRQDYQLPRLSWNDVKDTSIETISRGRRFIVDTEEDEMYGNDAYAQVYIERFDYVCG